MIVYESGSLIQKGILMPSFNLTNRNRMFISFHADVTVEQVAETLKKLRLKDEPIVKICRTLIIENNKDEFHLRRDPTTLSIKERLERLENR